MPFYSIKKYIKNRLPPRILDLLAALNYQGSKSRFRNMTIEEVFSQIYRTNQWGKNKETRSWPGSSTEQTKKLIDTLDILFANLQIQTILDIPCGDFNWIRNLELSTLQYIGADIVKDIILQNKSAYETEKIQFEHKDLTKDFLPKTDLVINRDCLVHFCFDDIKKAITNVINSNSTYLLTTTFPRQTHNYDIVTGDWRPINLQLSPFYFPKPLQMITETFEPEFEKENKGKALALWAVADLKLLTRFAKWSPCNEHYSEMLWLMLFLLWPRTNLLRVWFW